jgi:hypothetical protein
MSNTLVIGSAQTITSETILTPKVPVFGSYAYSVDDPGNAILKNVVGALDQPHSIRYAINSVADVFKQSEVAPYAGQSTAGVNILVQLNESWKIQQAMTSLDIGYLPVSAHIVLKLPTDALVTSSVVEALLARLIGTLSRSSVGTRESVLDLLLHGVTTIPDVAESIIIPDG